MPGSFPKAAEHTHDFPQLTPETCSPFHQAGRALPAAVTKLVADLRLLTLVTGPNLGQPANTVLAFQSEKWICVSAQQTHAAVFDSMDTQHKKLEGGVPVKPAKLRNEQEEGNGRVVE